jgi:hypothetical protein
MPSLNSLCWRAYFSLLMRMIKTASLHAIIIAIPTPMMLPMVIRTSREADGMDVELEEFEDVVEL